MDNMLFLLQAVCSKDPRLDKRLKKYLYTERLEAGTELLSLGLFSCTAFVESGLVKEMIHKDGYWTTTQFFTEGNHFHLGYVFPENMDARQYIAVEPVTLRLLHGSDLRKLYRLSDQMMEFVGRALYVAMKRPQLRKQLLRMKALTRLRRFNKRYPGVITRASLGDIASYLELNLSTVADLLPKIKPSKRPENYSPPA